MALQHASPGQVIALSPYGSQIATAKSIALFKSEDLEVMRLVLLAGKEMPSHRVAGEITIQCIEGSVEVTAENATHVLRPGHLLYLSGHSLHAVVALEDASILVTVVLKRTAGQGGAPA
ncbi:cupin domain-containing protein [Achromobacter seleniivolatilans]|uniref:Cupin domain-containing protein n=1 Tax=Achromobacter seleniivolatilans TaxID=3047478 RepID=A0ABY9M473_9BURK|nr:cupin domain-containing protein [Achromobacter sp. R39]WMD21796.1 cupin domain-containing protein [Achromobacter sp. R39]